MNSLTLESSGPSQRHPSRWKMLNLTWISFFLTFVVWFNLGPFKSTIGKAMHLSEAELNTLLICNVALTIPARIGVGILVDRFGPRRVFSGVLLFASVPTILFALSTNFWQLVVARLLISCVGAGFVVGIRLVSDWFSADEIGWAEGIYGGLGNFGMAAATFGLPVVAGLVGPLAGWRWAMAISGVLCFLYAFIFFFTVQDSPPGKEFKKPKRKGGLEVSSRGALISLLLMQLPMAFCLAVLVWKLKGVHLINEGVSVLLYACIVSLLWLQVFKLFRVNAHVAYGRIIPEADRYSFAQVAILCLCYAVTFGGELAVESMLPAYFEKMFKVSVTLAGSMGAGFAFASIVARPMGGWMGDKFGRKPIIVTALGGSALGFIGICLIGPSWSVSSAMVVVMSAGLFLMAGNGANFCIAPLIRKPLTGQIAGLIGAYGNVGSVLFLAVFALYGAKVFFITMTITGVIAFLTTFLLAEPSRDIVPVDRPATETPELPGNLAIEMA
jgi:MFS transporter, NNP family, nitrate/nitrite transporter